MKRTSLSSRSRRSRMRTPGSWMSAPLPQVETSSDLVRDDLRERRLAEPGRSEQEDVIDRRVALLRGLRGDRECVDGAPPGRRRRRGVPGGWRGQSRRTRRRGPLPAAVRPRPASWASRLEPHLPAALVEREQVLMAGQPREVEPGRDAARASSRRIPPASRRVRHRRRPQPPPARAASLASIRRFRSDRPVIAPAWSSALPWRSAKRTPFGALPETTSRFSWTRP